MMVILLGGVCRVFQMVCALGAIFLLEYKYCGRFAPAVPPAVFVLLRAVPRFARRLLSILPVSPVPLLWSPRCPGSASSLVLRVLPSRLVASFRAFLCAFSRFVARCGGWCLLVLPSFLFFARLLAAVCGCSGVGLRLVSLVSPSFALSRRLVAFVVALVSPLRCVDFFSFSAVLLLPWCWVLSLGSPAGCVLLSFASALSSPRPRLFACVFVLPLPCACSFRSPVGCALLWRWWRRFGVLVRVCFEFLVVWVCLCGCAFRVSGLFVLRCFACWMWGACRASCRRAGCFFLLFGKKIVASSRPLCLRRFFCVCLALALP